MMEYIYVGQLLATAGLFTWVGFYTCTTKNTKELLTNSKTVNETMNTVNKTIEDFHESIESEIHNSEIERGQMLLNQDEINKLIEENKAINLEIKEALQIKQMEDEEEKNSTSKILNVIQRPKK